MGHEDRGKALVAPDPLQQPLRRDASLSAPSGSSKARARGYETNARASATRCFWPPDSTEAALVRACRRARLPSALSPRVRAQSLDERSRPRPASRRWRERGPRATAVAPRSHHAGYPRAMTRVADPAAAWRRSSPGPRSRRSSVLLHAAALSGDGHELAAAGMCGSMPRGAPRCHRRDLRRPPDSERRAAGLLPAAPRTTTRAYGAKLARRGELGFGKGGRRRAVCMRNLLSVSGRRGARGSDLGAPARGRRCRLACRARRPDQDRERGDALSA